MKKQILFLCAALISISILGCDGNDADILTANISVVANDGVTPVSNNSILNYDWVIKLKDGSQIMTRFDSNLSTDANGKLTVKSQDLGLRSEFPNQTCTSVCVDYDYYSDWECVAWDYDEFGYEYCLAEDYVTTSYCSRYAEDCSYYYPTRDMDDVELAWGEIGYTVGASTAQTSSLKNTYPETALREDDETLWVQNDIFVTAINPSSSAPSSFKASPKLVQSRLNHARAIPRILRGKEVEKLNSAQKARLDAFRKKYSTQN